MNTKRKNTLILKSNIPNIHSERILDINHIGVYSSNRNRIILEVDNFELVLFDNELKYKSIIIGHTKYELEYDNEFTVIKNGRKVRLLLDVGELALYLHKDLMDLDF